MEARELEAPDAVSAGSQREEEPRPSLGVVLREWGRLGCIGFGGPPAQMALLRELCVQREGWLTRAEFEDAIAACNLLPGPAATQLAIFCAWRVRGPAGAIVGGLGFIVPGLLAILGLAALFLAGSPPAWVRGAGAGAGATVAAVAVRTGGTLLGPSHRRASDRGAGGNVRFWAYLLVGGGSAATVGPWLVVALIGCGGMEMIWRRRRRRRESAARRTPSLLAPPLWAVTVPAVGGLAALGWVALKVGALSYGGGFVIVPLMQHDAVTRYHWMTAGQFLNAVALGQVTPGGWRSPSPGRWRCWGAPGSCCWWPDGVSWRRCWRRAWWERCSAWRERRCRIDFPPPLPRMPTRRPVAGRLTRRKAGRSVETGPSQPTCDSDRGAGAAAGSVKRTWVPPGASASQMRPPWASTIARAIANPKPLPGPVRAASWPPR